MARACYHPTKSAFSDVFNRFLNDDFQIFSDTKNSYGIPAVNIQETEDEFILELAAPGLKKEDFRIVLDQNILTISTEKDTGAEKKYTKQEFNYSNFKRAFELPSIVNQEEAKAGYTNGILHVSIPKREENKHRTIKIS